MRTISIRYIVSIVTMAAVLSAATMASALSLQVRAGSDNGDAGKGSNIGIDLFFYEGRSFDFFIGYDHISVSNKQTLSLPAPTGDVQATTDATTNALLIGLRYKMQTDSSWKPYLSFGLARLDTEFTPQPGLEPYYEKPFEKTTTGMLLGLGVDVGVSDNWSVGVEGSLLTGIPYYENYFFGTGLSLDSYGVVTQLDLGLRYHFY